MSGKADAERREAIRESSDELIERLGELHALEAKKRRVTMSSKPFHDLAEEITDKSHEIFRVAAREEGQGDELSTTQTSSIEDEAVAE